jgi:uncharacterized phage-associated protein
VEPDKAADKMLPGYDIDKAAQATAFFALKAGGAINVLKLSKLLYLAEREAMARYDSPMFFDNLFSMPDGPVVSVTLNLINGELENPKWSRFVTVRSGYDIRAAAGVNFDSLVDLSKADIDILTSLWDQFGSFDRYALRDWTHKKENIPEWEDPDGSSYLISHEKVFRNLGKTDPKALVEDVTEYRDMKRRLERS